MLLVVLCRNLNFFLTLSRLELYVELHHVQPIAVPDELYSVPVPVGSSQMTMAEFGNSAKPFQLPLALSLVTAGDR